MVIGSCMHPALFVDSKLVLPAKMEILGHKDVWDIKTNGYGT